MEVSIECAHAGVTPGEWTDTLRGIYGVYRAPTGVGITSKIDKNESNLKEGIFHCSKLEDLSFAVDKILENKNDKFKENDLIWGKYILNNNKL